MAEKVRIHLYDLSQGLAKQLSVQFIGKQLDGIWHTGIVVYGKEYYFGGGICCDPPEQTPYGVPIQKIDIGETELPQEVFLDFLKDINSKFTIDTYDLFENNCNNFTDTCCEFLVGQGIPSYITGLPKEVLATPFGQMIKPIVDSFTLAMNQNSHPMAQLSNNNTNVPSQNNTTNTTQGQGVTTTTHPTAVQQVNTIEEFFGVLDSNPSVLADFFSFTCPPCMRIKPFYEKLANDYLTKCPSLRFISINTQVAREIAEQFDIKAIPTFIGFYDGMQVERFSGADPKKIEDLARTLEAKAKHVNEKVQEVNKEEAKEKIPIIQPQTQTQTQQKQANQYHLFSPAQKSFMKYHADTYTLAVSSIKGTLEKNPNSALNQPESKAVFLAYSKDPQGNIQNFPPEDKVKLVDWLLEGIAFIGIADKTMGFLDLLKMLCVDDTFAGAVAKNKNFESIINFFDQSDENIREIQKGLRLVLLRLITNVAAHESARDFFQAQFNWVVKRMLNVSLACKEEKPAVEAVLKIIWNIAQNLFNLKEFDELAEIVCGSVISEFNSNTDDGIVQASLLILCSLAYYKKNLRNAINEKLEKGKLKTYEGSKNDQISKGSKDLTSILEGKIY